MLDGPRAPTAAAPKGARGGAPNRSPASPGKAGL